MEHNQVVNFDGSYSYVYRTSNGINAEESGIGGVSAQGSYDYTGSDGVPISISYIADENGYQPTGDHLPQPPPIPEYIQRALEYIRNNPPSSFKWIQSPLLVLSSFVLLHIPPPLFILLIIKQMKTENDKRNKLRFCYWKNWMRAFVFGVINAIAIEPSEMWLNLWRR